MLDAAGGCWRWRCGGCGAVRYGGGDDGACKWRWVVVVVVVPVGLSLRSSLEGLVVRPRAGWSLVRSLTRSLARSLQHGVPSRPLPLLQPSLLTTHCCAAYRLLAHSLAVSCRCRRRRRCLLPLPVGGRQQLPHTQLFFKTACSSARYAECIAAAAAAAGCLPACCPVCRIRAR